MTDYLISNEEVIDCLQDLDVRLKYKVVGVTIGRDTPGNEIYRVDSRRIRQVNIS